MATGERGGPETEAGLHLLFDLGLFVGAIEIAAVERAFPDTHVELVEGGRSGPDALAAKDLARDLGLPALTRTWLLLQPTARRAFTAALGVGVSFGTRVVRGAIPLPRGIFACDTAISAVFRLDEPAGGFAAGRLGLVVSAGDRLDASGWDVEHLALRLRDVPDRRDVRGSLEPREARSG